MLKIRHFPSKNQSVLETMLVKGQELADKQVARFWSLINKTSDNNCWLWRGPVNTGGSPLFCFGFRPPVHTASRAVAWALTNGRWPDTPLAPTCGNPLCVNPAHLAAPVPPKLRQKLASDPTWVRHKDRPPKPRSPRRLLRRHIKTWDEIEEEAQLKLPHISRHYKPEFPLDPPLEPDNFDWSWRGADGDGFLSFCKSQRRKFFGPTTRSCDHCGAEFNPTNTTTYYCSLACQTADRLGALGRLKLTKTCEFCGDPVSSKDSRFCSLACYSKWRKTRKGNGNCKHPPSNGHVAPL